MLQSQDGELRKVKKCSRRSVNLDLYSHVRIRLFYKVCPEVAPSPADDLVPRYFETGPMLVSFKAASRDLCDTEARVARRIATERVDPAGPLFLLNNRLIRLDKDPRVRPVGIGELLQRIIGKSVLKMSKTQRFAFCFTQWERALLSPDWQNVACSLRFQARRSSANASLLYYGNPCNVKGIANKDSKWNGTRLVVSSKTLKKENVPGCQKTDAATARIRTGDLLFTRQAL